MLPSLERDIKEESCTRHPRACCSVKWSDKLSTHSRTAPLLRKSPQHYPRVLSYAEIPSKTYSHTAARFWPRVAKC